MTFVSEDAFSVLPVGETELEGRRDEAIYELEHLQDKGIHSRGELDMVKKWSVNEIDKEWRGKEDNSIIFRSGGGETIRAAR